jgi:hypothetical protein
MIGFAKFVNFVLALVVFGTLRVATADMGTAAWVVSLVIAIIAFYVLRAMFVSPLLKRATNKASTQIIQHFAGDGDYGWHHQDRARTWPQYERSSARRRGTQRRSQWKESWG